MNPSKKWFTALSTHQTKGQARAAELARQKQTAKANVFALPPLPSEGGETHEEFLARIGGNKEEEFE